MESYILRIYRYEPQAKNKIVGTLQALNKTTSLAFTNADELLGMLQNMMVSTELTERPLPEDTEV